MATYNFKVEEVSQGGVISWNAVDTSNNNSFKVNVAGYLTSGEFPEISDYLKANYSVNYAISYRSTPPFCDTFDQPNQTWTFRRNGDVIQVQDIPRTVYRITKV
jgi:hypothetical protein